MATLRIYQRVSTKGQKVDSQEGDLLRWAEYKRSEGQVEIVWYTDKFTGKSMDRPAFNRLLAEVLPGDTVAVWRLDRLGRTTTGLVNLFEVWRKAGVNFYSLKDSFDLSTASGRLVLGMLISIASYETELRAERIAAARETRLQRGEKINRPGPPKGKRLKVTPEHERLIKRLDSEDQPIAAIARVTGLSRPTIYSVLNQEQPCKS